jgi:capsular polysaccharide biosynthesis protein
LFKAGKLSTIGFNTIEVNKAVIEIKMTLLKVEQEILKLNSGGIEMAMQPYVSSQRVGPKILRNIALAGIISLLLGICLAFFIEYIGNIKNKNSKSVDNSSIE